MSLEQLMKNGQKIGNAGSAASYGDTWTTGDIIGVALDLDNGGNLYFSKNGTWQDSGDPTSGGTATGAAFTGLSGTFTGLTQMFGSGSAQVVLGNFGSDSSFAGTVTAQGNGLQMFDGPSKITAVIKRSRATASTANAVW